MSAVGSTLWPKLPVFQIYGANTGVGKTVFSVALCNAFRRSSPRVHYLKPISTGPLNEADDRHIATFDRHVYSKCLYQFDDPVSPHLAVRASGTRISDAALATSVFDELASYARSPNASGESDQSGAVAIVETAGGVLSPAPSGSVQADAYRPLRLPVVLIGDARLGGIGATISAWESLRIRGYDVKAVALFEGDTYGNLGYLTEYFDQRAISTYSLPPPPDKDEDAAADAHQMRSYYEQVSNAPEMKSLAGNLLLYHQKRVSELQQLPSHAHQRIWHPFMQHRERTVDSIVVMDSAHGDFFQTYKNPTNSQDAASNTKTDKIGTAIDHATLPSLHEPLLKPAFDGSASWWTQGLGHGNPQLALTAAYAAGRYGHVMFAGAVHEPALDLAAALINNMRNPRLDKVFFSDNGSTGMEVAVKMALRASTLRNVWSPDDEIVILGLKNSYHGDTIGTMDLSEPSIYNKKVEWYRGRGHWLDFPQVKMRSGKWTIESPDELKEALGANRTFDTLDQVFDWKARKNDQALYREFFAAELARLRKEGKKLGALIMEPMILGAGGMMLADPLYQRCLVEAVRGESEASVEGSVDWSGMPVIFDEVFTGLYRLGRFTAASFLGVHPDIVVNAKLLTGGLLPLCTTTASRSIFEAFLSDDKSDALLHGHSYTAHAVGCAVAVESLQEMMGMERDGDWLAFHRDWTKDAASQDQQAYIERVGSHSPRRSPTQWWSRDVASAPVYPVPTMSETWSMWSRDFVASLSHKANVDSVFALGSVLAITLKDPSGSGYASTAATGLRDHLLAGSESEDWVIHSRVLGNVLYLMAALTTNVETVRSIESRVAAAL